MVKVTDIKQVSQDVLLSCGVPQEDALTIADTIVYAHRMGKHTHGINRLPIYVRKIQEGLMTKETVLEITRDTPVIMTADAHHGFGQVAAAKGMKHCIKKAKAYGIGVVGIKDSNNFGTAGYFGELAACEGMIGIVMGNSAPAIAATGGTAPILGTNPICFAFPNLEGKAPIILDMALSTAARGKIRLAAKNGETIPLGWAMDEKGNPTQDPNEALKGSLIPIGDYKGFGLSLAVDILAGLLTGAAFGGSVKPLNHPDDFSRFGHFLLALNITFFMTPEEYQKKIDILVENVRKSGNIGEVILPGERSFQQAKKSHTMVALHEKQVKEINDLAGEANLSCRL